MDDVFFIGLMIGAFLSPIVAYHIYLYRKYALIIYEANDYPFKKSMTSNRDKISVVDEKDIMQEIKKNNIYNYYLYYFYKTLCGFIFFWGVFFHWDELF